MYQSKVQYIYNFYQADFFIKNDCIVLGCGTGSKGDRYILFLDDDVYRIAYTNWIDKKYN